MARDHCDRGEGQEALESVRCRNQEKAGSKKEMYTASSIMPLILPFVVQERIQQRAECAHVMEMT